jgi:hypothetical protein
MSSGSHPKWGDPGAAWNFEFSVNINQDGSGGATLDDYVVLLNIDMDPGLGQSWISFNPFITFGDNALGDNSTPNGGGADAAAANANYGVYSVGQNSINIGWLGLSFDNSVAGTYDFSLAVYNIGPITSPLAETFMTVEVDGGAPVPLPATVFLLGSGVAGLVGTRKRYLK